VTVNAPTVVAPEVVRPIPTLAMTRLSPSAMVWLPVAVAGVAVPETATMLPVPVAP
jgi:hypothetical protein